jgi:F-type H+-transporting ATPase subunit epsilon
VRLRVFLPTNIFFDQEVSKVIAEGENGSFCLLPHHIDFVTSLAPGIIVFQHVSSAEKESFMAVDRGILVKCADEVRVSTRMAVLKPNLGELKQTVEQEFLNLNEEEKKTRSILAKIEIDLERSIMNMEK